MRQSTVHAFLVFHYIISRLVRLNKDKHSFPSYNIWLKPAVTAKIYKMKHSRLLSPVSNNNLWNRYMEIAFTFLNCHVQYCWPNLLYIKDGQFFGLIRTCSMYMYVMWPFNDVKLLSYNGLYLYIVKSTKICSDNIQLINILTIVTSHCLLSGNSCPWNSLSWLQHHFMDI